MINYYQIIIFLLLILIIKNIYNNKEKMTITDKIIEQSQEQKIMDLNIIENENTKQLEDLSRNEQQFLLSPGSKLTKQHILTNLYTTQMIPF